MTDEAALFMSWGAQPSLKAYPHPSTKKSHPKEKPNVHINASSPVGCKTSRSGYSTAANDPKKITNGMRQV